MNILRSQKGDRLAGLFNYVGSTISYCDTQSQTAVTLIADSAAAVTRSEISSAECCPMALSNKRNFIWLDYTLRVAEETAVCRRFFP